MAGLKAILAVRGSLSYGLRNEGRGTLVGGGVSSVGCLNGRLSLRRGILLSRLNTGTTVDYSFVSLSLLFVATNYFTLCLLGGLLGG